MSLACSLAGLKFAGQRVCVLLSHMRFSSLYQHSLMAMMMMMMVTWGGVYAAPPLCLIDHECWCFDCQAKKERLCVEFLTFYRGGIDEPLCEGLEDRSFTCLNKTQHNSQWVFGPVSPLPVKVTWLDLQSLSRPQEEISNHTVSPAVRRDCLFPRKHGDMLRVVGRERVRSRWDLRDRSLLGLLECSCSLRIPGIVSERIMDKACILEMI